MSRRSSSRARSCSNTSTRRSFPASLSRRRSASVAGSPPNPASPHVLAQRVPLGTSVAGRIVLTEKPVYLPDLQATEMPATARKAVATGVRSYFGMPLLADGSAVGVLQVDSPEPDAWNEEQRELFLAVAPIVASAIQNARSHARAESARTQ